jgi:hypothetical protein
MKDAKGHGSNPRGVHSQGISALPTTKQMHIDAGNASSRAAKNIANRIAEIIRREEAALGGPGKTGPMISGIYSDKFPEHIKTQLRALHQEKNRHTDNAFGSYRKARLRLNTARMKYRAHMAD